MKGFGKYEVLGELASRPNVSVFRGHDRIIQRDVLLKVFQLETMSPSARTRFVRDVRSTVALTHPNIISIYDFEVQDGNAYLATEQLEGESLRDFLDRKGQRTLEGKLQLMIEVFDGLAFAHDNGVIHSEIRPENIFILRSGRPKILDFAIAQALLPQSVPDRYDQTSSDYMAPEQIRRQRGDGLSDVFSAFVVFFELLTNSLPFSGEDMARIQVDATPLMAKFDPAMPRQLARLIARGLSLDMSDRIQSAAGFAQELRMIAAELVVHSTELAEEVVSLREKIIELRRKLASDVPQIQSQLTKIDFSILERLTPEIMASISSEMDYFSIVELQKECHQALDSIEQIVAEPASPEVTFPEMDFSLHAAAEKVIAPGKVMSIADEKLLQIDSAIETGNVRRILAIVKEVRRFKHKWYEEYSITESEVESLEAACHKALDSSIEITRVQIQSAISSGDFAAAEEHFKTVEELSSKEPGYSELTALIREQIQDAADGKEPAEPRVRRPTAELISEPGRICTGCKHSNPMEAVVCEACGLRLPGTRRLTPMLEESSPRKSRTARQPESRTARQAESRTVRQAESRTVRQQESRAVRHPAVPAVPVGAVDAWKRFPGLWIAVAGAVVLFLAVAAFLLMPKTPDVAVKLPVVGSAVIAKDALLRTTPGAESGATAVGKGEAVDLLGRIPERNPEAWVEVQLKADGRNGFVRLADMGSIRTDSCAFDLWHVALLMSDIVGLDTKLRSERIRRVEAEIGRCPESATDDLRMTMAETYTHEAASLPWESAKNQVRAAKGYLANIQNSKSYAGRIDAVNVAIEGLAPASRPPIKPAPPAPTAAVKAEDVEAAEKLLNQGKIDLENAETRIQLNSVISDMNAISNMSFSGKRGLQIQAEAKKVRDKATNSLGFVN